MSEKIVVMTEGELEKLVFDTMTRANENLYKGLSQRYFQQFEQDIRAILYELEEGNR